MFLDPEGMVHPVVSVSALARFIRCIYFWNLQFVINVIIIKAKDPLPQAYMTLSDSDYPGWSLWYYCSQECLYYYFYQSVDFEHAWWRWFQRRVVCAKFHVYVFIDASDKAVVVWHKHYAHILHRRVSTLKPFTIHPFFR